MLHVQPPISPVMQRAFGRGECHVKAREGKTVLDRLWQEGCAKVRLPKHGHGFEAVLINSSGGLTGGDRMSWTAEAAAQTSMTMTTQACEKIYAAAADEAQVRTAITVGDGARVNWLPQETILFQNSALARFLEADLSSGSELLVCEPLLIGRKAMSETVTNAVFKDRWRIRQEGKLIHAEDMNLGPDFAGQGARVAALNQARAFATVMLIARDAEALLEPARAIFGDRGGASAWNGKLLARLVADDGYGLRQRLMPLLSLLNKGAALPKCWSL